jgi:hypothetical protein
MAAITGGNVLLVVTIVIVLLVALVSVMLGFVFNLDNLLSTSLVGIVGQEQVAPEEMEEDVITEEIAPLEVRQILGFVEYPVVDVQTEGESVFSPQAAIDTLRLSDEKIAERCAHVTIPFNHDRCMRAERDCADVLESSNEHWRCLHKHQFYIGKKL